MSPTYLTIAQVADIVQVHQDSVRRAIAKRQLKASRVGRAYRIRPAAVDLWLKEN